ncbi:phosphatidate cytidylyltransferase [Leptospira kanakyensis]|uniref:Phosphatidate cytidylyltransferase n=1 Tax=Leptospira kanakyensis TaxID=2484968 RepID=A0A6N4QLG4_9LEPT|nr:CDP-archaeol synthase [Leptospira kanakyensis]MCW7482663.1 phosphatidate cytidylyltransferase [Leptospira kanakyensis]TGK55363.1 CDP-archaeol synthase [Leptospira kanakyensis]TGK60897.1 CDP-archaeol synthase [Leptospira kanakyensis]TGK76628.1 CDP-archaeol synthase [Leptospira kanakyensis]
MSETTLRILSAIVLTFVYVFMIFHSSFYYLEFYAFGCITIYLGLKELYAFCRREDSKPFFGTGLIFSLLIFTVYYIQFLGLQFEVTPPAFVLELSKVLREGFHPIPFLLIALSLTVWILQILKRPLDGALFSASATILGPIYLAIPIGHFLLLLAFPFGAYYIFLVSVITFMSDAGAYFGGRWFGKHPAGLKISPKKTWEGYVTGNITAVLGVQILNFTWEHFSGVKLPIGVLESILVAFVVSVISVMGDLAESAMKRDAKIKDSGSLIPGHGGVLDLADALLFTVPVIYYYFLFKGILGYAV